MSSEIFQRIVSSLGGATYVFGADKLAILWASIRFLPLVTTDDKSQIFQE